MAWPTAVTTTGMDADTDNLPRSDILDLTTKFNEVLAYRGVANGICDLDGSGVIPDARVGVAIARLASPTLTGTPAAPTAAAKTNTTQIATTAFVGQARRLLRVTVLSGTGTYTPASDVAYVDFHIVGGGGGGAAGSNFGTYGVGGGGGGGGSYAESGIVAVAASYAYQVGAGGSGGGSVNAAGGSGTQSNIGGIVCPGGSGAAANSGIGGAGGTGISGGINNVDGRLGATGVYIAGFGNTGLPIGAMGGGSRMCSGGGGTPYNVNAGPGVYGSGGGGGGYYQATGAWSAGGAGGAGRIEVWEYA